MSHQHDLCPPILLITDHRSLITDHGQAPCPLHASSSTAEDDCRSRCRGPEQGRGEGEGEGAGLGALYKGGEQVLNRADEGVTVSCGGR